MLLPLVQLLLHLQPHVALQAAHVYHYFGRTFDIGRITHRGGHVFPLGREWFARRNGCLIAQLLIVHPLLLQPAQQGLLRRIAHIVCCRGVQRNSFVEVFHSPTLVFHYTSHIAHRHAVLRQRARLVGTNHRHGTHRLRCLQLTHKVVRLQHSAHVQRQGQRDSHRKTLGDSHDNQRDSHHEVAQRNVQHTQIIVCMPQLVGYDIVTEEYQETEHRQQTAYLADHLGQFVQLYVQRCLHTRQLSSLPCHMSYLRAVAYGRHHETSRTTKHHRRT